MHCYIQYIRFLKSMNVNSKSIRIKMDSETLVIPEVYAQFGNFILSLFKKYF